MSNDKVIAAFLERKSGNSANLHSYGVFLKSYAMVIAQWFSDATLRIVGQSDCPSLTTERHRNKLIRRYKTTHPNTYTSLK